VGTMRNGTSFSLGIVPLCNACGNASELWSHAMIKVGRALDEATSTGVVRSIEAVVERRRAPVPVKAGAQPPPDMAKQSC